MYLQKKQINDLLKKGELIIRPLLSDGQIGEITVDFRLGYDFLIGNHGRKPFIDASLNSEESTRTIEGFFDKTRRRPGETFLLHPNQVVVATSLEYIKLPGDIALILNMRSSYARLGMTLATMVHPGYCGCISLELTNSNRTTINLTVGARIVQARLVQMKTPTNYFSEHRKYMCQVRPQVSAVTNDSDLRILHEYWNDLNKS